ncbi:MAG: tyrosine--tRNA ligase [Actinomycetota bacterium]|nr:tyrosine--tRNA ligase [Actinomycetota bacterium]
MAASDLVARLTKNAVHVLPEGELERKLDLARPLRVKLGIDPTAPDIHVGHGLPLQRMAAFQREGHVGVLIVGDYTGRIGDPSGRSAERPVLSDQEIDENARRYFEQASQIIDPERTEVRFNGEWLGELDFAAVVRLTRTMTVARLLERDDFAKRFAESAPISVSELLYPLMQAYDSVAIGADVELGGTDQLYNLLAGRDVMAAYGAEPQVALTVPLLLGFDGHKMSASLGNYIGLAEAPEEQFGKTMRISDDLLPDYWRFVLESDEDPLAGDPLEAKLRLARFIVARSHGEEAATRAEGHFTRVVRERRAPADVPEVALAPNGDFVYVPSVLVEHLGLASTSEARRLIAQGGVKLNGETLDEIEVPAARLDGALIQAGKRRFARFFVSRGIT